MGRPWSAADGSAETTTVGFGSAGSARTIRFTISDDGGRIVPVLTPPTAADGGANVDTPVSDNSNSNSNPNSKQSGSDAPGVDSDGDEPGRVVQVEPMKPMLKAPGYMLLKQRCDGPL